MKNFRVNLKDGALVGLADGAQMTMESSVVEYIDNAEDAAAEKVIVNFDIENGVISVASKEKENYLSIDDAESVLYGLGSDKKIETKKSGVGKYHQGFKYSGPSLIGEGNRGIVRVDCIPQGSYPWSTEQIIDYTNPNNYTDCIINEVPFNGIEDDCNFKVTVNGCKNIQINDIVKLKIALGIRYREKITNNETCIIVNGDEIEAIDRLYTKLKKRVNYSGVKYLPWNGDDKAATYEWVDLAEGNIQPDEYCKYDVSNGIKGRTEGVKVSARSGIEVAIGGVTVIYERELTSLCGTELQPSAASFRGRLNILNRDLADAYIKGGNKSTSKVLSTFAENEDTEAIAVAISESHSEYLRSHRNDETNVRRYTPTAITDWYRTKNADYTIKFKKDREDVCAINKKSKENYIDVNVNNPVFKGLSENAIVMVILAKIGEEISFNEAYSSLDDFIHSFKKVKNGNEE